MTRWRPPRRVFLVNRWITVKQITHREMQAVVGDKSGADAAWESSTDTIYLMRKLSPTKKARAYAHEIQHALVDLMDQ